MVEIGFDFLKKFSEYIDLYKENKLPVMLCDSNLNVGWGNPAAETLYPHLTDKEGFNLLLGEFDKKELLSRMESEGSIRLDNLIGFSDILLGLTPIMRDGGLYGVVAELMGTNAVILPSKARLASQTPMRIEASIRGSVAGIFRAMDIATQMEHLLLEKAELKKLGLDVGFISASYDSVSKHCYYLLRMAENLSVYSGLNADPPTPLLAAVDVFEFISKTKDAVESLAEDMGIAVEFSLPDANGMAGLDAEKFELAFFNILNNAFYFTRDGNIVTITGKADKDTVSVIIKDRGMGIPADVMPYIFDPYFARGHGSRPAGIGLGLTIARSMIEAHGGKITVKSIENESSEFTVSIPRGTFTHRQTSVRFSDQNQAADKFSRLYVGLADAVRSPYNSKNIV